jgi:hypothetical protein
MATDVSNGLSAGSCHCAGSKDHKQWLSVGSEGAAIRTQDSGESFRTPNEIGVGQAPYALLSFPFTVECIRSTALLGRCVKLNAGQVQGDSLEWVGNVATLKIAALHECGTQINERRIVPAT